MLCTGGDTHLGGEDIDNILVGHFGELIKQQTNGEVDVFSFANRAALTELKAKCEDLKISLSTKEQASFTLYHLPPMAGSKERAKFNGALTRTQLETLSMPILTRCLDSVKQVLHDAGKDYSQIDEVWYPTQMTNDVYGVKRMKVTKDMTPIYNY